MQGRLHTLLQQQTFAVRPVGAKRTSTLQCDFGVIIRTEHDETRAHSDVLTCLSLTDDEERGSDFVLDLITCNIWAQYGCGFAMT